MMNTIMAAAAGPMIGRVPDLVFKGISNLISSSALTSLVRVTQGSQHKATPGWLHFEDKGKTLFVAKNSLRNNVTWNHLNSLGAVFGTKVVEIEGKQYKVRLMTGGNGDPASGPGGEWDRLMYAISKDRPADYQGPRLAEFIPADLEYGFQSAIYSTLCQETQAGSTGNCIRRGRDNLTWYDVFAKNTGGNTIMWRPVLELID